MARLPHDAYFMPPAQNAAGAQLVVGSSGAGKTHILKYTQNLKIHWVSHVVRNLLQEHNLSTMMLAFEQGTRAGRVVYTNITEQVGDAVREHTGWEPVFFDEHVDLDALDANDVLIINNVTHNVCKLKRVDPLRVWLGSMVETSKRPKIMLVAHKAEPFEQEKWLASWREQAEIFRLFDPALPTAPNRQGYVDLKPKQDESESKSAPRVGAEAFLEGENIDEDTRLASVKVEFDAPGAGLALPPNMSGIDTPQVTATDDSFLRKLSEIEQYSDFAREQIKAFVPDHRLMSQEQMSHRVKDDDYASNRLNDIQKIVHRAEKGKLTSLTEEQKSVLLLREFQAVWKQIETALKNTSEPLVKEEIEVLRLLESAQKGKPPKHAYHPDLYENKGGVIVFIKEYYGHLLSADPDKNFLYQDELQKIHPSRDRLKKLAYKLGRPELANQYGSGKWGYDVMQALRNEAKKPDSSTKVASIILPSRERNNKKLRLSGITNPETLTAKERKAALKTISRH